MRMAASGTHSHTSTCSEAALNGHLGVRMYAHQNGCAWDDMTCYAAASRENLDCLN
jgi:hypothetical protein